MRCLVVGFGSIGQRHARILAANGDHDVAVLSRRDVVMPHRCFDALTSALEVWRPEYVVIASGTHEHRGVLDDLDDLGYDGIVLVEKPLFADAQDIRDTGDLTDRRYVGYNLRFHPVLLQAQTLLAEAKTFAVSVYVGQDLRQWRPTSDYRKSYSADRRRGGGVLRDLSHEVDYMTWMFGGWRSVMGAGGKFSDLEIDSDDVFSLLVNTPKCPSINIQLNYLDSNLQRVFRAQTSRGTLIADFVQNKVQLGDKTWNFQVANDDTYIRQHAAVLNDRDNNLLCTWAQGEDVVRLISAAEMSASKGVRVCR